MRALTHARKELEAARRAMESLRAARDLEALDQHWVSFLRHLERTWFKACTQLKVSSKFQGWPTRGNIEQLRSKDPLLAYLRFARGAEEHGVEPISEKQRGGIGIRPTEGTELHLDYLALKKGQIEIRSRQPFAVTAFPAKYTLVPVKHRGVVYAVPTSHLDSALATSDPVILAETGYAFYQRFLDEAEQEFVR